MCVLCLQASNQETCRIAEGSLGRALALRRPEWEFGGESLSASASAAVVALLKDNDIVEKVGLASSHMTVETGLEIASTILQFDKPDTGKLAVLDLAGVRFDGGAFATVSSMVALAQAVRENASLLWIRVDGTPWPEPDDSAWLDVADLRGIKGSTSIDLAFSNLGWRSAIIIGNLMDISTSLRCLSLAGNSHLDAENSIGIESIAKCAARCLTTHTTHARATRTRANLVWFVQCATA